MGLLSVSIISLVLNLDAFFFGIAFGLKNIRIYLKSKLIIFVASLFITCFSYLLGKYIANFFSRNVSHIIGSTFMIFIGFLLILRTIIEKDNTPHTKTLVNLSLKSLGLTIKIIKEPQVSDINQSGTIEPFEAIFIALALSLDALSAIFSLALSSSFKLYVIFLIPTVQFIAISTGNLFGQRLKKFQKNLYVNCLPGVVLIGLAILNLLKG